MKTSRIHRGHWPAVLVVVCAMASAPARAQWDSTGGPAGDFRSPDRPIGAPALRSPEAAGFPSDSMKMLDSLGPQSAMDVLKALDKDLGSAKRPSDDAASMPGSQHTPGEDLDKRPAAPTTIK